MTLLAALLALLCPAAPARAAVVTPQTLEALNASALSDPAHFFDGAARAEVVTPQPLGYAPIPDLPVLRVGDRPDAPRVLAPAPSASASSSAPAPAGARSPGAATQAAAAGGLGLLLAGALVGGSLGAPLLFAGLALCALGAALYFAGR